MLDSLLIRVFSRNQVHLAGDQMGPRDKLHVTGTGRILEQILFWNKDLYDATGIMRTATVS